MEKSFSFLQFIVHFEEQHKKQLLHKNVSFLFVDWDIKLDCYIPRLQWTDFHLPVCIVCWCNQQQPFTHLCFGRKSHCGLSSWLDAAQVMAVLLNQRSHFLTHTLTYRFHTDLTMDETRVRELHICADIMGLYTNLCPCLNETYVQCNKSESQKWIFWLLAVHLWELRISWNVDVVLCRNYLTSWWN